MLEVILIIYSNIIALNKLNFNWLLKRKIDKKLDNLYKIYQKKKGQKNTNLNNKLIPSLASFSAMAQKEVLGVMVK